MAKMIGLSRNIKMSWLNKTVDLLSDNLNEDDFKKQLNEYLGFEIKSETNIRKTREILMHIWYYDNPETSSLRMMALNMLHEDSDNALACHWCMMLAEYPVFVDVCRLIGKLAEFEEEITLAQIKQKIFDEWGERTTLFHSIDKMISTLKNIGVIVAEKPGEFRIVKQFINNSDLETLIFATEIQIENKEYCTLQNLKDQPYMFPFEYQIGKEMLMTNDKFDISNLAGEMIIRLNRNNML